jgi:hypothetical protein
MTRVGLLLKKYWWLALAVAAAAVGFLVAGRRAPPRPTRPEGLDVPARPELPDVGVSPVPEVDMRPADRYRERANEIDKEIRDRVAAGNERYR